MERIMKARALREYATPTVSTARQCVGRGVSWGVAGGSTAGTEEPGFGKHMNNSAMELRTQLIVTMLAVPNCFLSLCVYAGHPRRQAVCH
jgi:hypothetical protein